MNHVVHKTAELSQSRRPSLGDDGLAARSAAVSLKAASIGPHFP